MQPGNNFRVVADIGGQAWLNTLKVKQDDAQARVYEADEVTPVPTEKCTDLLTVWRKLHLVVESMGAEPPGQQFDADDLLRGDVPAPDTGGFADAFDDAYIDVVVVEGNPSTTWSYNFQLSSTVWRDYIRDNRADVPAHNYEGPEYWQAYILGTYESQHPLNDNDPDADFAISANGWREDPEGATVHQEVVRDVLAQHGLTEQQQTHYRRYVAVHEVGHQFGLWADQHPQSQDNVGWAPGNDAEEPLAATLPVPIRFLPVDLDAVRWTLYP
jgi:hypothetical protein